MTINEYLKYAIKNNMLDKLQWYFTVLGIPGTNPYEDEFITYNGKFKVKINDELIDIESNNKTLLNIQDEVTLTHDDMSNIKDKVTTTVGRVIVNYLLSYNPFGNKIEFINDKIVSGVIENKVKDGLVNNSITIDEYIKFVDNAGFISNLSRLVTISATPTNIVSAPGIEKYKKELIKEYETKYGKDWTKQAKPITEFENKLTEYDNAYLKSDPTYGKLMSGKVKNTGRHKMLIDYGNETSFNDKDEANLITNSLIEGWPKDKKSLAAMFNSTRSASYSRGQETASGGVLAKTLLRTTSSYSVSDTKDCGTKRGKHILVTESNKDSLADKYMIESNKTIAIKTKDINSLVGKVIEVRSPAYCLEKGSSFCQTCSGENLVLNKDAIPLMMVEIGSVILKLSLKAMHAGNTIDIIDTDITKIIK